MYHYFNLQNHQFIYNFCLFVINTKCCPRGEPTASLEAPRIIGIPFLWYNAERKEEDHDKNSISSMVPPLKATLVLGKKGVLWFRDLMNIHHLDRSLLLGFMSKKMHQDRISISITTNTTTTTIIVSKLQIRNQTILSFLVVLLKPSSCWIQLLVVYNSFPLRSLQNHITSVRTNHQFKVCEFHNVKNWRVSEFLLPIPNKNHIWITK